MHLHLVFVGKTATVNIDEAIRGYLARIKHYADCEVHIIKAEKMVKKTPATLIQERESERILDLVQGQGHLLVWDRRGRELDSPAFARFIDNLHSQGTSALWMVIGGPLGMSQELLEKAHSILALSQLTFPHDVARLLVMEQTYRAFTILRGEPYHK
jgi:23S rRNA (pseudouridine1915-N3)-methyltransferase